ncbi:hypothetical protein [Mycobacterium sp. shizuoka-1]|uniref:hypothetical protein n=1 Tax=Mycobacterium sp. shizuoka-1 TaxID=2039281 RepID=UPI000C0608C2|nr:hypothetical protein [Mycobacterium sp. shizuoka-1]GAY15789.1 hypothetical protein MSZK_25150 [Mycobacterium sp. shizuoka-1]
MTTYVIKDGRVFELGEDGEAGDILDWIIAERCRELDGPLVTLSRQQVVTRLGRGIPEDFPGPDVVVGDPEQGPTRGWWEPTVQRYLLTDRQDSAGDDTTATQDNAAGADEDPQHWPRRSRQWDDVALSAADHRVLIATSYGIVTPAGEVKSRPLGQPGDLGKLATRYRWSSRADQGDPQVWITGEALEALNFPADQANEASLPDLVAEFFGATVKYAQSGYFTCQFSADEADGGSDRTIEVILMPATSLQPSAARPSDRGIIGIEGTDTLLPDDEVDAAHLLGDRIAWLHEIDEALPAPRWTRVGVHIAESGMRRARPKPKTDPQAKVLPCPLPAAVDERGKFPSQWWGPASWRRKPHRSRGKGVDVELDQQAAYLPSAEGLYLGYGKPQWESIEAAVFDEQRPPFGLYQITVPAADSLDGLSPKLPVPHPGMSWTKESTFWATTIDVQQLIAPPDNGGAGLAVAELQIEKAWVWPEQHQWLKQFGETLRARLVAARAAGRTDYENMIKAIYTSYLGRLAGTGEGAFKHPYLHHQQPAWYAAIEGFTRWRALRYARRIGRDFDLYPTECLADAWFYRVPDGINPADLQDPLRSDGTRTNGSYRLKSIPDEVL